MEILGFLCKKYEITSIYIYVYVYIYICIEYSGGREQHDGKKTKAKDIQPQQLACDQKIEYERTWTTFSQSDNNRNNYYNFSTTVWLAQGFPLQALLPPCGFSPSRQTYLGRFQPPQAVHGYMSWYICIYMVLRNPQKPKYIVSKYKTVELNLVQYSSIIMSKRKMDRKNNLITSWMDLRIKLRSPCLDACWPASDNSQICQFIFMSSAFMKVSCHLCLILRNLRTIPISSNFLLSFHSARSLPQINVFSLPVHNSTRARQPI